MLSGHGAPDARALATQNEGKLYGLSMHVDRLLRSATSARIDTSRWSKEELVNILLQTVAASGKRDGVFLRYWLSAGARHPRATRCCPATALPPPRVSGDSTTS